MDDLTIPTPNATTEMPVGKQWHAELTLAFSHRSTGTYLSHRLHQGPLVVQKTLHPEGPAVCHAVIVHPPGGVAGGDVLRLNVTLHPQARALLTTPGAGKWYKAHGGQATQQLRFTLAQGSMLEWLPQENILFNAAQVAFQAEISLAHDAKLAMWDIVCLGRQAQQEVWASGHYALQQRISRAGQWIWHERAMMRADDGLRASVIGLAQAPVFGTFLVCAGRVPEEMLAACRAIEVVGAKVGITALPEVLAIRYVGAASQQARNYFEQCWQLLRPWYDERDAQRPRIWNT